MSRSRRQPTGSPPGLRLKVVLALYVLAAALMPLAHHDLLCHARSTTHCTTCVVGSSAEAAPDPADLTRLTLTHVGEALAATLEPLVAAPLSSCSGRAPPSAIA